MLTLNILMGCLIGAAVVFACKRVPGVWREMPKSTRVGFLGVLLVASMGIFISYGSMWAITWKYL